MVEDLCEIDQGRQATARTEEEIKVYRESTDQLQCDRPYIHWNFVECGENHGRVLGQWDSFDMLQQPALITSNLVQPSPLTSVSRHRQSPSPPRSNHDIPHMELHGPK